MIPILVAWRPDQGHRDQIWKHLRTHYWDNLPYRIVEGASPDGPFNRAAAVNAAAHHAAEWDVAVIADADTWVPAHRLAHAVTEAQQTGKLVAAFNHVLELSETSTHRILSGEHQQIFDLDICNVRITEIITQSSMLAIPRTLWDKAGGMDEQFLGWGGEDNAFWYVCRALAGEPIRLPGPAFHLWHEPALDCMIRMNDPQYRKNLNRWQQLSRARTPQQLAAIQARLR